MLQDVFPKEQVGQDMNTYIGKLRILERYGTYGNFHIFMSKNSDTDFLTGARYRAADFEPYRFCNIIAGF